MCLLHCIKAVDYGQQLQYNGATLLIGENSAKLLRGGKVSGIYRLLAGEIVTQSSLPCPFTPSITFLNLTAYFYYSL